MSDISKPKALSLFAGAGGCSLGFEKAGFEIVYANDIDNSAISTYKLNFPNTLTECKSIHEINFKNLIQKLNLKSGEVDVVLGGPPCQGFSSAGNKDWKDSRNKLLQEYFNALETIKPKWFLMENVEGLLTSNSGKYVSELIENFLRIGYSIRMEKIYAQDYEIPQRRKRVIILGNRLGINFDFPKPISYSTGKIFRNSKITLEHAFSGLPKPSISNEILNYESKTNICEWTKFLVNENGKVNDHYSVTLKGLQKERVSSLLPGQTMKDLPEKLQHASFKKRANRRVKDGTPSEKRGGAPSGLKRLVLDEPCLTITSAAIREFVHPLENRCLTLRECARIQTFPDNFNFNGSVSNKIQQIGNAIPPSLAENFAKHIIGCGFEKHYDNRKGIMLGFKLSKSKGLSPALKKTEALLEKLRNNQDQLSIF